MKKRILALAAAGIILCGQFTAYAKDYANCSLSVENGEAKASFHVESDEENLMASIIVKDDENNIKSIETEVFDGKDKTDFSIKTVIPSEKGLSIKTMLWNKFMNPLIYGKTIVYENNPSKGFVDMNNVTLNDGMFKTSQDLGLDYVLSMDVDRLLAPSFEMAGLPTPNGKVRYGGWEKKGASNWGWSADTFTLAGHTLGHWMSAASVMYASTKDEEVKSRLDYAVSQLGYIQETTKSGYIGGCNEECFTKLFSGNTSSWANNYWVPWYGIHKIYQGLIDAYEYTGNYEALNVCTNFADWAMDGLNKLTDSQVQTMLNVEYGGMNDVFARLYKLTGRKEYLTTARRFTHDNILNPLINEQDALSGLHANTQIPKIIGAAEIFENDSVTYQNYGKAAKFFWDRVVNTRSYVIGGNSVSEHFEAIGLESLHHKTAESCNTYNMLKLTEHLYNWEHKSEYMDFYEKALYNHILGSQDPETGNKMYFVSLLQGHYRIYGTMHDSFWCCTGTGMENPGRYSKCIYYKDNNDLYINLYIPSTVTWEEKNLTLTQETSYPYEDKIRITIADGEADATLKFRVPSWAKTGATATYNGEVYTKNSAGYLEITNSFKKGDVIELTIPMELEIYNSRTANQVAFTYGPVVLAAPLGTENFPNDTVEKETGLDTTTTDVPFIVYEGDNINELIEMVESEGLTFKLKGEYMSEGEDVLLKPFYEIHHQFHNVYWNMNMAGDLFLKRLNNVTIDQVQPDGQQDELGHNLETNSTGTGHNGSFSSGGNNYMWRDAWGSSDSYFSYMLGVDKDIKNYLCVAYWGSDGPFNKNGKTYTRDFSIYVDGVKIATQVINNNKPGSPYYCYYEIPKELTKDKEAVTVKWQVNGESSCAGGVLEARIVSEIIEQ
ncbi:MAG: beta-L-arabinofuranosidase domain-containing protein [Clostridia bacterium]